MEKNLANLFDMVLLGEPSILEKEENNLPEFMVYITPMSRMSIGSRTRLQFARHRESPSLRRHHISPQRPASGARP